MKQHFEPYLDAYDLANLSQRSFYCKTMVRGQVKDPFSLKSLYIPDVKLEKDFLEKLYEISRSKYSRSLLEAKKAVEVEHKDVIKKLEDFSEPLIKKWINFKIYPLFYKLTTFLTKFLLS